MPYSLLERSVERELMPMAHAMGLGVIPWSALGGGVLSGKYQAADITDTKVRVSDSTRKAMVIENGYLTKRGLAIAEVVKTIAAELGKSASQVALAWTMLARAGDRSGHPGVRTLAQVEEISALSRSNSPTSRRRGSTRHQPLSLAFRTTFSGIIENEDDAGSEYVSRPGQ